MNWVDIVLLIILAVFVLRGISRGLFRESFALAGVFFGLVLAINRYVALGAVISSEISVFSIRIASLIAFVLIFVGIALLGTFLGIALHSISRRLIARSLDQGGGVLFGLAEGAVVCSVILLLVSVSPLSGRASEWIKGSMLAPHLMKVGPSIYDRLVSITPGKAKTFMDKLRNLNELEKLIPGEEA